MGPLAVIVIAGVALLVLAGESKAKAHEASHRRQVTGKSGHTWFVEAAGSNENSVLFNVFASDDSNDLVLVYRQITDGSQKGTRLVQFEAPSSLTPIAKSDFI